MIPLANKQSDAALAAGLLAPALTVLLVFGLAPTAYALYLSFHESEGRNLAYVGAHNYAEALRGEPFWDSVWVTVYYALGVIPLTIVLSVIFALMLHRVARFHHVYRTLFFLPYVTSIVAAAMIWRTFFEPQFGLANHVMGLLGLRPQQWLLEPRGLLSILTNGAIPHDVGPSLALCCVIVFEVWRNTGFVTVLLLAGLASVPRDVEDAARLDGASGFRTAWSVLLPLLSPTLFFVAIVSFIGAFQAFGNVYALTGNGRGPLDTTQNLTVHIYSSFYEFGRLGYGAAVAVLLCAALASLTALQWRALGRRVHYQ